MLISTSILGIYKEKEKIKKIDTSSTDYIHIDVMDGIFVQNKVSYEHLSSFHKKIDIHLMALNIEEEIQKYLYLKPEYITFHLEAASDISKTISFIKQKKVKVGISIKPDTEVEKVIPYLKDIDLVLIMSVEPGKGGQEFLPNTTKKIKKLASLKEKYDFLIEVDGGINDKNIGKCKGADLIVAGTFITSTDEIEQSLFRLRKNFL